MLEVARWMAHQASSIIDAHPTAWLTLRIPASRLRTRLSRWPIRDSISSSWPAPNSALLFRSPRACCAVHAASSNRPVNSMLTQELLKACETRLIFGISSAYTPKICIFPVFHLSSLLQFHLLSFLCSKVESTDRVCTSLKVPL